MVSDSFLGTLAQGTLVNHIESESTRPGHALDTVVVV
jgi:hypothetical protein